MVKRILIDARMYGLENAGIGRYIINLIDELKIIGKDENYIILLRKKYFDQLKFPKNWKKLLTDFRHYTLEEQIKLPGIIKKENPSLVHFPHINIPFFYNGKFVVTIHDMTMHYQGKKATSLMLLKYYAKRIPYKIIFRKAVLQSEKIIVPSKAVKNEIANYFSIDKAKMLVTYEGLDKIYRQHIFPKLDDVSYDLGEKYFVYTGNAYPHKNLKRLIKAVVYINNNLNTSVNLVIVGSRNIFLKRLEDLIDYLGAKKFVKLLGYVPDEYLKLIYKNSIAFIFPSLSEGFGLPGIEAMASGTLLLASDIPIFREIYQTNCLYFNPHKYKSIIKAMKNAMKISVTKRKKIIQTSQKFVKRYSWGKMAKNTLGVYKDVLIK